MCKARSEKDTEDRRCDCDTSEARRLRRHTRAALNRNADLAYKPIAPNTYPNPVEEITHTAESIRSELHSIPFFVTQLREQGVSGNDIFSFIDKRLNSVGAGIEYLAENKYGAAPDEVFRDTYDSFSETYLSHRKDALASGMTKEEADEEAGDRINPEFQKAMQVLFEQRNNAMRQALIDVGVEFADPNTLKYTRNSDKEAVKLLKNAMQFYPQTWVDASNKLHSDFPLQVKSLDWSERAGYQPDQTKWKIFNRKSVLSINEDEDLVSGGMSAAVHEFAHRVEHSIPEVTLYEKFFLMRRSGHYSESGNPVNSEELSVIQSDSDDPDIPEGEEEYGYRDNFPNHYMGRVYGNGYYEILSMGMETLFSGTNGGFAGIQKHKADPDYKRFILGVLASASL
jgi:hypothetical protein